MSPYVSREPNTGPGRKTKSRCQRVHFAGQGASYPGVTGPESLTKPAVELLSSSCLCCRAEFKCPPVKPLSFLVYKKLPLQPTAFLFHLQRVKRIFFFCNFLEALLFYLFIYFCQLTKSPRVIYDTLSLDPSISLSEIRNLNSNSDATTAVPPNKG